VKLLVTGGAGFIGSVVTRMLLDAGHQVVVLDDLCTGHRQALAPEATHVEASIHDAARVLTPDAGFDGVLHFAALIAAGESMVKPELYWQTNTVGSLALIDAVRAAVPTPLSRQLAEALRDLLLALRALLDWYIERLGEPAPRGAQLDVEDIPLD
jgi:UDP-glucose 4-epimerase